MGNGDFLVAAPLRSRMKPHSCASVLDRRHPIARAEFRRTIAQRCLYGVDINPMAVQLGRLSIWLPRWPDRPLTFLDHRLRIGNSSSGNTFRRRDSHWRQRSRGAARFLYESWLLRGAFATRSPSGHASRRNRRYAEQVRAKERALSATNAGAQSSVGRSATCGVEYGSRKGRRRAGAVRRARRNPRAAVPRHIAAPLIAASRPRRAGALLSLDV
jgi:hypothetical protein